MPSKPRKKKKSTIAATPTVKPARRTKSAAAVKAIVVPQRPAITVEVAGHDEASFRDVFELIMAEHEEVAYEPLSPVKAAESCYHTLAQGMTLLARDANGSPIGTLGIVELAYWYSDRTYLQDVWLYVKPEHRCGAVLRKLLSEAKRFADDRSKVLIVTIANPHRRIKRTPLGLVSQEAGYVPFMYSMRVA